MTTRQLNYLISLVEADIHRMSQVVTWRGKNQYSNRDVCEQTLRTLKDMRDSKEEEIEERLGL